MSIFDFFYDLSFASLQFAVSLMQTFGPLGFFFVMIIQAIVVIIPSEGVLVLGGTSYGLFWGSVIGGFGVVISAVVAFFISRKLGRPIVERLVGKTWLKFADRWFIRYGGWAVLIARLMPFIPFDAISYASGLTKMDFKKYFIATFIGSFPRAVFYSFLGTLVPVQREGMEPLFIMALAIIGCVVLAVVLLRYYLKRKMLEDESVAA